MAQSGGRAGGAILTPHPCRSGRITQFLLLKKLLKSSFLENSSRALLSLNCAQDPNFLPPLQIYLHSPPPPHHRAGQRLIKCRVDQHLLPATARYLHVIKFPSAMIASSVSGWPWVGVLFSQRTQLFWFLGKASAAISGQGWGWGCC